MKKTESGLDLLNQEELNNLMNNLYHKDTKGLLVLGGPGIGKSTIMKKNLGAWINGYELNNVTDPANYQLEIRQIMNSGVCEYREVISNQEGLNPQVDYYPTGVFIDDIGTDRNINVFGNLINPLEFAIQHLYNVKVRLWANSNLNLDELTEKYGLRVVSRLKEMCYIVVLEGHDHREDYFNANLEELVKPKIN